MDNTGSAPDLDRRVSLSGHGRPGWVVPLMKPVAPTDIVRRSAFIRPIPTEPTPGEKEATRETMVEAAVSEWTRRLVNLDGHNRMLYFRELRKGTLELSASLPGIDADAIAELLSGKALPIERLFNSETVADAALRTLALAAKARSNFEEKGVSTLHVGYGFATWTKSDGHTPSAPSVMFPARIRIIGPSGHDAVLQIIGAPQVNPAFRHAMRGEIGVDPYPVGDDLPIDPEQWTSHIAAACADVQDFEIDDRLFLANFEFSKLPMVKDLESHLPMLVDNDLVAAFAGDPTAQSLVATDLDIDADLPDRTAPEEEFLVRDADASQSRVIAAALVGQNLVVHGPPGTGKSQTIANLISSLAAAGKSVLFVAEKRAAISAVTRRLEEAGCAELVLDLHDGTRRRHVIRSLGDSLAAIDNQLAHDAAPIPPDLVGARKKLVAHRRQMHQPREPHGFSFFELQATVGTPDMEKTGVRLAGGVLEKWTEDGRAEVHALLERWQSIADRLDEDATGVWASSAIRDSADADQMKAEWKTISSQLIPAVEDAHLGVLAELGLHEDNEVPIPTLAALVQQCVDLTERHGDDFIEDAETIAADLAPVERSAIGRLISSLTNSRFRAAKRNIAASQRGAKGLRLFREEAANVTETKRKWRKWFPGVATPGRVASGRRLAAALAKHDAAWGRLEEKAPGLTTVNGLRDGWRIFQEAGERLDLADVRVEQVEVEASISQFGLGALVRETARADRAGHDLKVLGDRVFAASAVGAVTWQEPELAMFVGKTHQEVAESFAKLDRENMEATPPRVLKLVAERAATVLEAQPRQLALLRSELDTETYQMPVRQLLRSVTEAGQALRPCWAMSPLLVSQLLPADAGLFDVVIFDEGSQILPIHAIPAIARARQAIVAGDSKQLPPSQFLASETMEDHNSDDADGELATSGESILDVMTEIVPERSLLWHYRSQDERLITFSNAQMYDRSLVTFPATNMGTGVHHVLAEGLPATAAGTSSNPEVVKQVVRMVLEHARRRPEESLGVIAVGVRHANEINRALRVARLELDEDFGNFFEGIGFEPFFVKVMTDAQGDERDRIILSIGYGKNPEGKIVYRWDALNQRGGERRLNVAITRAKRHLTVVTSIKSDEIDPERTKSPGTAMLRDFLEYAETGGQVMPGPDTAPLTAFEISVREKLTEAGIPVEPHYGGGPLRIDFAAFDAKFANRPVLAIETDGLGYNSSATARDRDRIRLEVLAKRGWRHHRIWSADWYRNPAAETDKVKAAWVAAMAAVEEQDARSETSVVTQRPVVAGRGRCPIVIRRTGILGYESSELVQLVQWIQSDGISRSDQEVVGIAVDVLGLKGLNNFRAERALRSAVAKAADMRR